MQVCWGREVLLQLPLHQAGVRSDGRASQSPAIACTGHAEFTVPESNDLKHVDSAL